MHSDLLKISQLAAAAAWQTPLGDEIHDLAVRLLRSLEQEEGADVVDLAERRAAVDARAA